MCRGCVCSLIIIVVYLDYLNILMGYYSYLEGINNTGHTILRVRVMSYVYLYSWSCVSWLRVSFNYEVIE